MKPSYVLYGILAGAVLIWLLSSLGTPEEGKIRAQLDKVAELVAKDGEEKALESADKARRLGELFTDEMVIALRPVGMEIHSPAELVRPFVGLRQGVDTLGVSFDVEELTVAEGHPTASMTARATVVGRGTQQNGRQAFRLKLAWKKVRGTWLIESFDVVEQLDGNLLSL